ncbi:MAG: S8 family serine peptidase [bacterium]|nr:S8 family serine peptidase [bacterium]
MKIDRRRSLSSVISALVLVSMLLGYLAPLTPLDLAQAQEVTPETTPEAPSPTPEITEPPTTAPTGEPTAAPTETTTTAPTPEVTEEPNIFTEDFQDGDLSDWLLSPGFTLASEGDNVYLTTTGAFETATIPGLTWQDVSISGKIGLQSGNTANIAFRVGTDNYNVTLNSEGRASLYQGVNLLAQSSISGIPSNPTGISTYFIVVQAIGGQLLIAVDGVVQITHNVSTPLPAGLVVFSSGQANTGEVRFDDIRIERLDLPPVIGTATPPQIIPTESLPTFAPSATPPAEVTVETTPETTPESTPESTPEATTPPTVEPTPEATPENTPEPPTRSTPVLSADFEAELEGWVINEAATIIEEAEAAGNKVLSLSTGAIFRPASVVYLTDLQLNTRAQFDGGELTLDFRSADGGTYRLVLTATTTALYRVETSGGPEATPEATATVAPDVTPEATPFLVPTALISVPVERDPLGWYSLSLNVSGGTIVLSVDGEPELTYTDTAPLLGGELRFTVAQGTILLDDVAVYDFSAALPTTETIAPIALTDSGRIKLGGALTTIVEAHTNNDTAGALALAADYRVTLDDQSRLKVAVWGAEGLTGADIAALVEANGGTVTITGERSVEAFVSLDGILNLVNQDSVAALMMPDQAVSTGVSEDEAGNLPLAGGGFVKPHSLDTLGVNSWHTYRGPDGTAQAGVTGQGVRVGVIDTGFAFPGGYNPAEAGCLGSASVDGGGGGNAHGVNVVEIICDIAPDSLVYMFRAGSAAELATAINRAAGFVPGAFGQTPMDVIVIAMETAANNGDVQTAIQNANTTGNNGIGIPVIVSAGNTGTGGDGQFDYAGQTTALRIQASAGTVISYSWDDPAGSLNYPSTLSLDGAVIDSRSVRLDTPGHFYTVPERCGEQCELTLTISGDTPNTIDVRAAGGQDKNRVTMAADNAPLSDVAGDVSAVAASQFAIAVGAVCANQPGRYPIVSNSSRGPAGQTLDANIKPEVVAPSFVNTSLNTAQPVCESSGFGGTSAAAAHVGGMAALLLSNGNNPSMGAYFSSQRAFRMESYLMTRVIDLVDDPNAAAGFDRVFGSGLVQLGNPNFNLGSQINFPNAATLVGGEVLDTEAYYVGVAALPLSGVPIGSPTNPFVHPQQAINLAKQNNRPYVIFQPGEYVSSFNIPQGALTNNLQLLSYAQADASVSLRSSIWVNDNYEGAGGILIENVTGTPTFGLTIGGFDFAGATPLYEALVPFASPTLNMADVTPLYILNSVNVALRNNNFDNFDAPVVIDTSRNILLDTNVFSRFIIAGEADTVNGRPVVRPGQEAIALDIIDSGYVPGTTTAVPADSIRIYNSAFTDSSIPNQFYDDKIMQPVISLRRSYADIRSSRFERNTAQAIIYLNQWVTEQTAPVKPADSFLTFPLTVFSSLFDSNVLTGPIVHNYQGPNMRFVNNTVTNHVMQDNATYSSIILIGLQDTFFVHVNDHRMEIHNNLFFANSVRGALVSVGGQSLGAEGCKRIGVPLNAGAREGAQNNWFIPRFAGGECESVIGQPTTPIDNRGSFLGTFNNQFTNPVPFYGGDLTTALAGFAAARFFGSNPETGDPDNPYRLRPLNPTTEELVIDYFQPSQGVDAGNKAFAAEIWGVYDVNLTLDVMGLPRLVDRTKPQGGEFNQNPGCDECQIDIGAYELAIAEPVRYTNVTGAININISEDAPVVTFRLDQVVTGGFRPYRFFLSNPPTIYNTDPSNACGGRPFYYEPNPADPDSRYLVSYCPPADFFTDSGNPNIPTVTLTYQAQGLLFNTVTDPATITINIAPVNDGPPQTVTTKQVVFTQVGTPINYRLRPYVEFAPAFFLSDPEDEDYFWTFDQFTIRTGPDQSTPNWIDSFGANQTETTQILTNAVTTGRLELTPRPGWEGVVEFSYRVRDRDAGDAAATRIVRIVVTRKLAGPGMHDDASLDFVYQPGWTPFYSEVTVNNTLHYTVTQNSSFSFYFIGDAFLLQMIGFPSGANYEIRIDPDDQGPILERVYNATQFGSLVCSDPSKPASISTNTAAPQFLYFGCRGLSSLTADSNSARDQLRKLTIRHISPSGQPLIVDAINVRGEGLPAGVYEENDPLSLTFNGSWIDYADVVTFGPYGGTLKYTTTAGSTLNFRVDGSTVDALVVYRTVGPGAGDLLVTFNNSSTPVATIPSDNPLFLWRQPYVITNIPNGVVNVRITSASSAAVSIEAIELVGFQTPLAVGEYRGEDERIKYVGAWTDYVGAGPADGRTRYGNDLNGGLIFQINGSGVVVNYVQGTGYGQFQVCVGTTCQTFNGAGPLDWSQQAVVRTATSGVQTVVVRSLDSGYVGIDSIKVLGAQPVLTAGLYEETDEALVYTGVWTPFAYAPSQGGSFVYTVDPAARISWNLDASQMDRLVIYHGIYPFWGTMQVYSGASCTPGTNCVLINQTGTAAFGRATVITKAQLGLSNQTNVTISVRAASGYVGFEGFQIVRNGPLTPGYYEETVQATGFNLAYNGTDTLGDGYGGWSPLALAGSVRGGSMVYTNSQAATATFTVVPNDIDGVTIYYTTGPNYGTMQVFTGANCTGGSCVSINSLTPTYIAGNKRYITKAELGLNTGATPVTITIRTQTDGGTTNAQYIGLEGLEVVDTNAAAGPNENLTVLPDELLPASDSRLRYIGSWLGYSGAGPLLGVSGYTLDATAALRFKINGQGVAVYRTQAAGYSSFEMCIGTPTAANCQVFNNTATSTFWSRPAVMYVNTPGTYTVEIRALGGGYIGIEAIDTLGAQPTLPISDVIEETDVRLRYAGTGWVPQAAVGAQGGTLVTTTDTTSTISFRVNATQFQRLAVYYPTGTGIGWGGLNVCGTTCVDTATSAVNAYGAYQTITPAQLGITGQTNAQVTIKKSASGAFAGFEGLQLLTASGPLTPGYYEETLQSTGFNLTYTGPWTTLTAVGSRGGSMTYANSTTATATFSVIPDDIAGIVFYHTMGPGYGGLEIFTGATCTAGTNCTVLANTSPAAYVNGNRVYVPKASLGITTGAAPVTITLRPQTNGLYAGLEALHIISANLTTDPTNLPLLDAGRTLANSANLRYIGSWATYNGAGPLGNVFRYSNDPTAAVMFQINGDGIGLYRLLYPGYGSFQVCINGAECQNFSSNSAAVLWSQQVFLRAAAGTRHVVEIRNLGATYMGVEAVDVLPAQTALQTGYYEETDPNLRFTAGNWASVAIPGTRGGTLNATNDPNATLTFVVNAAATDSIALYYPTGSFGTGNWVPLEICNGATCQQTTNSATLAYAQRTAFTAAQLGLPANGSVTLTVSMGATPGFVGIEALEIIGDPGPVGPGYYEQDNFNFTYGGGANAWQNISTPTPLYYSGGFATYTGTANATLSFQLSAEAAGFIVFTGRGPVGAPMRVCYTRQGGGEYCPTQYRPVDTNLAVTEYFRGYVFYGLQTGATHTVTITNLGTAGEFLLIDAIAVLESPAQTLTIPAGEVVARYDDSDARIVYGPSILWAATTYPGYYLGTLHYSAFDGAVAQVRIQGNSLTLYQPSWSAGSADVSYCLMINTQIASNVDCSDFSQNDVTAAALQSPITLYGFGTGIHDIIFENDSYGLYFIVDALEVR